jgi:hypothetical protein
MTKPSKASPEPALTDLEHEAMRKSGELAQLLRQIIGDGPHAYNDWVEASIHIHAIQNMILSQAAARAYPDTFRLLGQQLTAPPDSTTEKR